MRSENVWTTDEHFFFSWIFCENQHLEIQNWKKKKRKKTEATKKSQKQKNLLKQTKIMDKIASREKEFLWSRTELTAPKDNTKILSQSLCSEMAKLRWKK